MNIKKPSPDTMKEQAVRQAKDLLITVLILTAATGIGNIFWYFSFTRNIISVYILGTLLTSLFTKSYFYGFLSSFSSVLLFNFCFTEPRLTLHAYERGYPVTFAIMLIVSIITVTLAIQNIRNAEEKERAAVRAKNEQLRADLLRTISHDLRTPLTSISGNASNLISNYEKMDDPTRKQTFLDIYDDSMWLINLVENILSISRIEDGRMNLSISTELVSEVFEEALRHTNRHSGQHTITVQMDDDLLLACFGKADGRLIDPLIQGAGCAGRTSLSCAFDFHADHIGRVGDPDLAFLFLQGEQCAMLCRLDLRDSVCPGFYGERLIHPNGLFAILDGICDDDAQFVFALIQADPIAPEPAGLCISAAVDASLQRCAVDEELDRADIGIALDVRAE